MILRARFSARTLGLLLVSSLLLSCSATRLMYNQLDWLAVWYIDDYFSLTDDQRDSLREAVDQNLEWHRRTQLPRYADFCRELDRQWVENPSIELIEQRYDELMGYWYALLGHAMPDITEFLLSLSDEQVADFLERVEENNQEMIDEYSGESAERRLKQRQKVIIKITRRFVGRLNDNQKAIVRQYAGSLHDNSEEWIEGRRIWQTEFSRLLRERPEDFADRVGNLLFDPNQFDSATYREQVTENTELIFDMYEVLLFGLTDKQRATLSKRLNRYADDFEDLAAANVQPATG